MTRARKSLFGHGRTETMPGDIALLWVPNYPSILLIVDANFKIENCRKSEFPMASADKRAEYRDILGRYEGRTSLISS